MGDFILNLLNSPLFVTLATTLLSTIAVDSTISGIKQIKDAIKDMPHEAQLLDCLEHAFFATEKELGWKHDTEAIYDTFFGSLMTFAGKFDRDSLTKIFIDAVSTEVTDNQVELWIENVIKQISLPVHAELREFLKIHHLFYDNQGQSKFISRYILTRNAPMCENPDIIFRDTIVHDLLEKVSVAGSRVQIAGMGGLGKTEILNKLYAQLAKDKQHTVFDHIALITFSGEIASDIESQIDYPRPYLGLQGVEAAKRYLQDVCQEKNVLLCIDDIRPNQTILKRNDPSLVFLKSLGASVLLTSRVAYPELEVLDLNFLPTNACISIFEKKSERTVSNAGDIEILTDIIENRAGNHTMIVNRLGNMAKDYGWSIPTLSERLKEKNFCFAKGIDDDELLQQEINKLYQINDELSPAEINILEAFSIFPASPLPFDLCVDWLHEDAGIDDDKCALLLNKLAEQTWLEKRCNNESIDVYFLMHQLVRTAVHEQSAIQPDLHQKLIENCADSLYNSVNSYDFSKSFIILNHAVSLLNNNYSTSIPCAKLTGEIGLFYCELADYKNSLEWYWKSLEICNNIKGEEEPQLTALFNNIALVYKEQGDYNIALEWYQKALALVNLEMEEELSLASIIYNNIGLVYQQQGKSELALENLLKSLSICENIADKNQLDVAITYTNIASVYADQGKRNQSYEWNLKALTLKQSILAKDHPSIATSYSNIAKGYDDQGLNSLALEWHHKALAIRKLVLGKDHPETAATYTDIANIYRRQSNLDLSLEWHLKALAICEKWLGKDHPETATIYNNIALVYSELGKYDLALEMHQKALAIRESKFDTNHPDIAASCANIAAVYRDQENQELAMKWELKALEMREAVLGTEHPDTAMSYSCIALNYKDQGKYDLALEWNQKALVIRESVLGKSHPGTANTYNNMAQVYEKLGKQHLALEFYKKVLAIREPLYGVDHPYTYMTYLRIASIYANLHQFDFAEQWYLKAMTIQETLLGKEHTDTVATLLSIAAVTEEKGDYNLALKSYERALTICEEVLGANHTDTAKINDSIAHTSYSLGKYTHAYKHLRKAYKAFERELGSEHPTTIDSRKGLSILEKLVKY